MRRKYRNPSEFTPSRLPKKFLGKFKVEKVGNEYAVMWKLSGTIGMSDFNELFKVVDVIRSSTDGRRYVRVFNPEIDRWLSENCLVTSGKLNDELSAATRALAAMKFGTDCGKGGVWEIGCSEKTRFLFGTRYKFEILLFSDDRSFINEYGEVERILDCDDPVRLAVENLPVFRKINRRNHEILMEPTNGGGKKRLGLGYQRFFPSAITECGGGYVLEVSGGENGSPDWKKYMENFMRLFKELDAKFDTWLIRFDNDALDDIHTIYLGFRKRDGDEQKRKKDGSRGKKPSAKSSIGKRQQFIAKRGKTICR